MIFLELPSRRKGKFRDEAFRRHSWGAIAGAAVSVVGGVIASNKAKKKAGTEAPYENVDLQKEQSAALAGNLESQGSIEQLLARANQFQQGQAISLTEQAMPGYTNLTKTLSDRAKTLAENPYSVPKEVEDNLARIAAERGIRAGTRGQFNDFSLLRDFGVNSLQYGRENLGQAQSITSLLAGIAPRVNPMSPLSFYVTPQQNAGNTTNNNTNNQAIRQGSISAQNAASGQADANLWSNLSQLAGAGIAAYSNRSGANTPANQAKLAGDVNF